MALNFITELPEDEVQARSQHKAVATELVANPGLWAEVGDYSKRATATSLASDIDKGKQNAYAKVAEVSGAGRFEAKAVTTGEEDAEQHRVYARWVAAPAAVEADADEDGPDFE